MTLQPVYQLLVSARSRGCSELRALHVFHQLTTANILNKIKSVLV